MSIFPFYRLESTDVPPQFYHRRRTPEGHSPPPQRKSLFRRIWETSAIHKAWRLRRDFNSRFDNALRHNNGTSTSQETLSTLKERIHGKKASGPGKRLSWVSQALGESECDLDKIPLTPYFPKHCRVPAPPKASEPKFSGRPKRRRDEGTSDERGTHPINRHEASRESPVDSSAMMGPEPGTSSGRRAEPHSVAAAPASITRQSPPTVTPSKRRASKSPESDSSSNKRPRLRSPTPHAPQSSPPDQPTTESRQSDANPKGVSPGTQAIIDYSNKALDDARLASIRREEDLRNDVKFIEARLADARQRISELEQERNNLETQLVAARQEHMPLHFIEFRRQAEQAIQQLRQQNAELTQENRGLRDGMSAVNRARDEALKAAAMANNASKAAAANASSEISKLRKARDDALKKAAAADDALKAALASSETMMEQSRPEAPAVDPSHDTQVEETSFVEGQPSPSAFTKTPSSLSMWNMVPATSASSESRVEEVTSTAEQQTVTLDDVAEGEGDDGREQVVDMQAPSANPFTSAANPFASFSGEQAAQPLSAGVSLSTNSAFGPAASQMRSAFPPPSTVPLSTAASAFFSPTRPRQSDGSTIAPVAGSSRQGASAFGGSMAGMSSAFASGSEMFAEWGAASSSVGALGKSPRKVVVPAAYRVRTAARSEENAQHRREMERKKRLRRNRRDRDA